MASQSPHLGLIIPTTSDAFSTTDVANNWSLIDKYPGTYLCTSTSRPNSGVGGAPTWTAANNGQRILETDTGLEWKWNGSQFTRVAAIGRLGGNVNNGTVSVASGTPNNVVTASNINIPSGSRWLQITSSWVLVQNDTSGKTVLGVYIDSTLLREYTITGDSSAPSAGAQGGSGSIITSTQVAAGLHSFSVKIRTVVLAPPNGGGTSQASGVTIDIVEV